MGDSGGSKSSTLRTYFNFQDMVEIFESPCGGVTRVDVTSACHNNLMLASSNSSDTFPTPGDPSVVGILNDWDMASELTEDGEVPNSTALHRTGTLPFMATDLLVTPPPPHYRHDLESFFYILIWAAVHYDLKKQTRRPTSKLLALWGDQNQGLTSNYVWPWQCRPGIQGNDIQISGEKIRLEWISPLHNLFHTAFPWHPDHPRFSTYDHVTCDGQLTFETFMDAIGIKPRSLDGKKRAIVSTKQ